MKLLNIGYPANSPLSVFGRALNDRHDFIIKHSNPLNLLDLDVLIWLDSRGISKGFEGSLAKKIFDFYGNKQLNFLLVCRPIEITVWATLLGFLKVNKLKPKKIITNMGIVDFTPKKKEISEDLMAQVNNVAGASAAKSYFVENYKASNSGNIPLYLNRYEPIFLDIICKMVHLYPTVIINTPLVSSSIQLERSRPSSFYDGLGMARSFNQSILGATTVDIPSFDRNYTYDGVHYTNEGNNLIFNLVKEYL